MFNIFRTANFSSQTPVVAVGPRDAVHTVCT